jgi:hypothetical protein
MIFSWVCRCCKVWGKPSEKPLEVSSGTDNLSLAGATAQAASQQGKPTDFPSVIPLGGNEEPQQSGSFRGERSSRRPIPSLAKYVFPRTKKEAQSPSNRVC